MLNTHSTPIHSNQNKMKSSTTDRDSFPSPPPTIQQEQHNSIKGLNTSNKNTVTLQLPTHNNTRRFPKQGSYINNIHSSSYSNASSTSYADNITTNQSSSTISLYTESSVPKDKYISTNSSNKSSTPKKTIPRKNTKVQEELLKYQQEIMIQHTQQTIYTETNGDAYEILSPMMRMKLKNKVFDQHQHRQKGKEKESVEKKNTSLINTANNMLFQDENTILRTEDVSLHEYSNQLNVVLRALKKKCSHMLETNERLLLDNDDGVEGNKDDIAQIRKAHELLKEKHAKLEGILAVSSSEMDLDDDDSNDDTCATEEYDQDVEQEEEEERHNKDDNDTLVGKVIVQLDEEHQQSDDNILYHTESITIHEEEDESTTISTATTEVAAQEKLSHKASMLEKDERIQTLEKELYHHKHRIQQLEQSNEEQEGKVEQTITINNELHNTNHKLTQQISTMLKQSKKEENIVIELQERLYNKEMQFLDEKSSLSTEVTSERQFTKKLTSECNDYKQQIMDLKTIITDQTNVTKEYNQTFMNLQITIKEKQKTMDEYNENNEYLQNCISAQERVQKTSSSELFEIKQSLLKSESQNSYLHKRTAQLEMQEIEFLERMVDTEQEHINQLRKKEDLFKKHNDSLKNVSNAERLITCISSEEGTFSKKTEEENNARRIIPSLLNSCSSSSSEEEEDGKNMNEVEVMLNSDLEALQEQIHEYQHQVDTLKQELIQNEQVNLEYKKEMELVKECRDRLDMQFKELHEDSFQEICGLRLYGQKLEKNLEDVHNEHREENNRNKECYLNTVMYHNVTSCLLHNEMNVLTDKLSNNNDKELQMEYKKEINVKDISITALTHELYSIQEEYNTMKETLDSLNTNGSILLSEKNQKISNLLNDISTIQTEVSLLETNLIKKEYEMNQLHQSKHELQVDNSKKQIQLTELTEDSSQQTKVLASIKSEMKLLKDAYATTKTSTKKQHMQLKVTSEEKKQVIQEKKELEQKLLEANEKLNHRETRLNTIKAEIEHLTIMAHSQQRHQL